jgi:hypothetical protein
MQYALYNYTKVLCQALCADYLSAATAKRILADWETQAQPFIRLIPKPQA